MIETTKTTIGELLDTLSPLPPELRRYAGADDETRSRTIYARWRKNGGIRHLLMLSSQPPAHITTEVPTGAAVRQSDGISEPVGLTTHGKAKLGSGDATWTVEAITPDGVTISLNGKRRKTVSADRLTPLSE